MSPTADGWGGHDPPLTADEAGQLAMMQIVLVGIGAGAAAALLFASVASGSILATLLFYLAPLPILIAALGWSHLGGPGRRAAAPRPASALSLGFYFFLAFLIGVGAAGVVARLSRAARRGRSRPTARRRHRMVSGRPAGVVGRDHRHAGDRRRRAQFRHRQGNLPGRPAQRVRARAQGSRRRRRPFPAAPTPERVIDILVVGAAAGRRGAR